jgi:radical SAM-linked protein
LGYTSVAEYIDLTLSEPLQIGFIDHLKKNLPEDFFIIETQAVISRKISLSSRLNRAIYEVPIDTADDISPKLEKIMNLDNLEIERETKDGSKTVDIRPAIYNLDKYTNKENDNLVSMELGIGEGGYARPSEVILAAGLADSDNLPSLVFHRKDLLYIDEDGNRITPMEF